MDSKDEDKIKIRPELSQAVVDDTMTLDEQFQNHTLRPVLKMQHEVLKSMVKEYIRKKKNAFYSLRGDARIAYIKNNLLSDRMMVHELRGLIIGMFTQDEIEYYLQNKAAINKRIQSLLFQRISSFL